jgi:hypothetical protein
MEERHFTRADPPAHGRGPRGVNMPTLESEDRERLEGKIRAESESFVAGVIVDSWVELAPATEAGARLVLQVALEGRPEVLIIVEAAASLVSDRLWLEDLSENLCHGSPVLALGSQSMSGLFAATRLQLTR